MKFFTNEVKIALVALVAIVVLFFGMNYLKGLTMFSSSNNYYAQFSDISGVTASSPVYANGLRVGVVEGVRFDYDHPDRIVAVLGLDKQLRLPRGTRVEIASDLLGNVQLQLKLGDDMRDLLTVGDTIEGGAQKGLMSKAAEMVPQVEQMLPKLDSILASLNALLADPAIASSLHNVENVTATLTQTTRQLSQLSTQLNRQVPQVMQRADGVLANTEGLTRQLNDLDLGQTMKKVDATIGNLQQTTAALNSQEGTMGLMMRDPALYRSLQATVASADSLLSDIKQHPKRYINVSVFGRKEK
ncbi:MAG: MCE family protein [Prevotella sp.]|nr:MCE family protein [Prevotella sp.]